MPRQGGLELKTLSCLSWTLSPQPCPSLVTTRPSGWWKWTPISTLHPRPVGSGSCPLPSPVPLDLTKFPETRPLPHPLLPWPLVAAQVGAWGERPSWQGWGFSGSAGPHGRAENRLPPGSLRNMSPGERDLELRGGGDRGDGLLSTFSSPLRHKVLHPSFLWHCWSCTAVL